MKLRVVIALVAVGACGRPAEAPDPDPAALAEVNAAAAEFLSYAHSFNYMAMRENAMPDFEILIFGQRLSLDGFIALLQEMEESRGGRALSNYELEGANAEIVGDVAYTTWASPNWLESAIFVRSEGRWLMDRAASMPIESRP